MKEESLDSYNKLIKEPHGHGYRLNSIIGPQAKGCTGAPTYSTTYMNKTVNVDKIKHIFIVLVLPTKLLFKH